TPTRFQSRISHSACLAASPWRWAACVRCSDAFLCSSAAFFDMGFSPRHFEVSTLGTSVRHLEQSLLRVLERRQHLKPVLCPAGQHNLVVSELEAVVTDDHHVGAHAQKA